MGLSVTYQLTREIRNTIRYHRGPIWSWLQDFFFAIQLPIDIQITKILHSLFTIQASYLQVVTKEKKWHTWPAPISTILWAPIVFAIELTTAARTSTCEDNGVKTHLSQKSKQQPESFLFFFFFFPFLWEAGYLHSKHPLLWLLNFSATQQKYVCMEDPWSFEFSNKISLKKIQAERSRETSQ